MYNITSIAEKSLRICSHHHDTGYHSPELFRQQPCRIIMVAHWPTAAHCKLLRYVSPSVFFVAHFDVYQNAADLAIRLHPKPVLVASFNSSNYSASSRWASFTTIYSSPWKMLKSCPNTCNEKVLLALCRSNAVEFVVHHLLTSSDITVSFNSSALSMVFADFASLQQDV